VAVIAAEPGANTPIESVGTKLLKFPHSSQLYYPDFGVKVATLNNTAVLLPRLPVRTLSIAPTVSYGSEPSTRLEVSVDSITFGTRS